MSASLVYITVFALPGRSSTQDSAIFRHWVPKATPVGTAAAT